MPIHDQGYRHWNGRLRGRIWRSLVIANCGIRLALKKRNLIAMVLLCIVPTFYFGVALFWVSRDPKSIEMIGRTLGEAEAWGKLVGDDLQAANLWALMFSRFMMVQLIPVGIIVTVIGPELISKDLRVQALQVYYSRPLTRVDYILGKLLIVALFVAIVTFFPAILLYLVAVALEKDIAVIGQSVQTLVGISVGSLLTALVAGVVVLACSSLSRRAGTIGIVWAMLLVLPEVAYQLVKATCQGVAGTAKSPEDWSHLLSIRANLCQVFTKLFGLERAYDLDWFTSFFVLAAVVALALGLLFRRAQVLEGEH